MPENSTWKIYERGPACHKYGFMQLQTIQETNLIVAVCWAPAASPVLDHRYSGWYWNVVSATVHAILPCTCVWICSRAPRGVVVHGCTALVAGGFVIILHYALRRRLPFAHLLLGHDWRLWWLKARVCAKAPILCILQVSMMVAMLAPRCIVLHVCSGASSIHSTLPLKLRSTIWSLLPRACRVGQQ